MNEYKFSDIKIGLEESFKVIVDDSKMDKFLNISKDTNPLHIDDSYAKKWVTLVGLFMGYLRRLFIQH